MAKHTDAKDRANTRTLLPIVALGGGLAVSPAMALELGELTVQSSLGQPLRASIAYALAPNEMVSDSCVAVSSRASTSGLPGIGASTVSITERAIVITGQSAIREPMLGARVTINCPYTPNLSREYMLLVDPAPVTEARLASPPPVARPEEAPVITGTSNLAPVARTARVATPVGQSTSYQVQVGETLSDIVARIENRSVSLWPAVNAVFAANPDAFIDNDPNKLKAGSWLDIPSLDGTAPVISAAAPQPVEAPIESAVVDEPAATVDSIAAAYEPEQFDVPAEEAPVEEPVARDATNDLKPGDVVIDTAPAAATETIVIPDTELEGPQTTSTSPNVPTAVISTGTRSESTSLLMWLIGGGLAIIAGLLFFGRRNRERFGSTPIGPVATQAVTHAEPETAEIEVVESYDIEDDSPTEENLALDADLEIGTGLEQGVDVDVAQDFGFAQTTNLDIELPFEPEAPAADASTDILPPMRNVESILESEVLPEDDDYDMSVIVDATQMPEHEDVTERDLKAVAVEDFTISQEADYDVLTQDYEDELTATQALNLEIERAAATLADDLNESTGDDEVTSEMPLASVTEIDKTAELLAGGEEKTAEFEASYDPNDTNAVTVNMTGEDKTAEMPVANDDETAEMEISGGKVDTKA